ncbi:MAG: hypothetical protein HYZ16_01845 [Bacteroidetes bacterium]|jgi:hypothetical protein|nr:hypothetical protein [Bacteroidota bacterium]
MQDRFFEVVLPSDLLKYFDITGWSWDERVDKVSLGTLVVDLAEKNELRLEGCPAGGPRITCRPSAYTTFSSGATRYS